MAKKILILGAAGRDFHNFNVVFRGKSEYEVVGFTATQIPGIADRRYPWRDTYTRPAFRSLMRKIWRN